MSENQKTKSTNVNVTIAAYDSIADMTDKAIAKELKAIAPRAGRLSLTERNMLECLAEGGKVVSDIRDKADRDGYAKYMVFADGDIVSLRPDGFRYLVSKANKYDLVATKSDKDMVTTWIVSGGSKRMPYIKRLVELFDAI